MAARTMRMLSASSRAGRTRWYPPSPIIETISSVWPSLRRGTSPMDSAPFARLHILKPGDLLTAIRIPSTWAGAQFYFEKVRDRNVWDFPLMNVASAMHVSGDTIEGIRLAVNGAAARPLRLKAVEDAVRGKAATPATGEMAGKLAVQGSVPLQFNAYKIPLMR